ncbi:MAG: 16S rRNA (adenine(1518)-N(6)/adenine(1519)-N(6))-dimethyltransferase RsmA [Candidatus Nanopelagicales bacterium]|jgi:16S rRNA (adenine1518-N6/adenine1519-N6)-dimethyltransferase|nr:16S rRNA (adenine(1518)-N(6)/adenine(1519)-N(6))-dimethyltransferase RsmA [Candidatus Nanopelagicales bacterium]
MALLGPARIRELARQLDLRPTKRLGQNFVIDPNTVRKIAAQAGVGPGDVVLEVGPGLGSLTLALLETGAAVQAVEIDGRLAEQLPVTVGELAPDAANRLTVICADALEPMTLADDPTAFVANLPYNTGVPILLNALERYESIASGVVMVQLEVAQRLTAAPGSRQYGVPSVKLAWWASAHSVGRVGTEVFWPAPNVQSGLVGFTRHQVAHPELREPTFAAVDAAFAQRRKMLRSALRAWAAPLDVTPVIEFAGIDPSSRGESLTVEQFSALASAKSHLLSA